MANARYAIMCQKEYKGAEEKIQVCILQRTKVLFQQTKFFSPQQTKLDYYVTVFDPSIFENLFL